MALDSSSFGKAFAPLDDTTPVSLDQRTGCTWPVTLSGNVLDSETFYCNATPVGGTFGWCKHHRKLGEQPWKKVGKVSDAYTRK